MASPVHRAGVGKLPIGNLSAPKAVTSSRGQRESVGSTASTPSPKKRGESRSAASPSAFYRRVEEVFDEYCVPSNGTGTACVTDGHRGENSSVAEDGSNATQTVPLSLLGVAAGCLRLHVTPAILQEAVSASRSGDGLDRDEFLRFVRQHLRSRMTAEIIIHHVVLFDASGKLSTDELRAVLQSDALRDDSVDGGSEPLSDAEFCMLVDRVDTRSTGVIHVGCLVRVLCPDDSEEEIEALLEKYGVGATRRVSEQQHIKIQEQVERESLLEVEYHPAVETLKQSHRFSEQEAKARQRTREEREAAERAQREADERRAREEVERKRLAAEEEERARRLAAERAVAEAAERKRKENEEAERRREEERQRFLAQVKAQPGCCKVSETKPKKK